MKYFKVYGDDLCVMLAENRSTNVLICSEIGLNKVLDKIPVGSSISVECLVDSSVCDSQEIEFD